MGLRKKMAIILILSLCSLEVMAGTLVCNGKVKDLSYHANNKLMIKLEGMNVPVFFCSPDSEWSISGTSYITGPEMCKTMYSTFLAAKMSGKTITSARP